MSNVNEEDIKEFVKHNRVIFIGSLLYGNYVAHSDESWLCREKRKYLIRPSMPYTMKGVDYGIFALGTSFQIAGHFKAQKHLEKVAYLYIRNLLKKYRSTMEIGISFFSLLFFLTRVSLKWQFVSQVAKNENGQNLISR